MNIKRRFQYKYRSVWQFFNSIALPTWCGSVLVRCGLLGILVFVSVAYIIKINTFATSGYELAHLENQRNSLGLEVKNLEIEKMSYESMNSIQSRLNGTKMTTPQKIEYISSFQPLVARR